MTVAQLIEKLQTMNPAAIVAIEQIVDDGTTRWSVTTFGFYVKRGREDTYVALAMDD